MPRSSHRLPSARRSPFFLAVPGLAVLALALLLPLAVAGCGGDEASVEEGLEERGTMDVIEQASEAEYEPPADGELTEDQVEMYLEVQERALEVRRVAQKRMEDRTGEGGEGEEKKKPGLMDALRAMGDVGDLVTAELRAAQDLGHNPAEYRWVQEQIVEAQLARMGHEMQAGFQESSRSILASLEEQKESVEDEQMRQQIEEQIAQYEANLEEQQADGEMEPGVEHNIELIESYAERIRTLQEKQAEAAS